MGSDTSSPFTSPVAELAAREEIGQLLIRRGRAADAKDPDAILALHVPGSRDAHGIFDGTIEEFVEHLRTHNYADERYGRQRHTIGNVLINFLSASAAEVESYHLAYHRLEMPAGSFDVFIGGRYLDRCDRLDGRWRVASRSVIYDWSRASPAAPTTILEDA